jgi:molybdate transport system substrate-binding protein
MLSRRFASSILLFAVVFACVTACLASCVDAQRSSLRVAAASDLQLVMPEIAKAFEDRTGTHVEVLYGSSGNFFAQIQNGAPFDLFFSADDEFPLKLIQSGRAEPRSAVVYGVGGLVLWTPANVKCNPQVEKWNCLLKPEVLKIAIANPAHAPYGRAAIAALQTAHIYDQVRTRLVFGENISQVAQFVQSGNAQAGILAYSQISAPAMRDGKGWTIPRDNYPAIQQTVVVLKAAREESVAEDFVKFVSEGSGRQLLEQFGFRPPPPSKEPKAGHK